VRQFQEVARVNPQDRVSQMLVAVLTGDESAMPPAPPLAAGFGEPSDVHVPIESLLGSWSASGPDGRTFALTLSDDGNFEWTFGEGAAKQTVKGVFGVDGAVLGMEPDAGGVLLAEITPPENAQFSLSLIGAPPGEPPLVFRKAG
jgi:hypothetical protein